MILQNAIKIIEDGKIIKSCHVHDYVVHTTASGKEFMIDGGCEYLRHNAWNADEVEELFLNSESSQEDIENKLVWGTYGIKGDQPLTWVFLKDCETNHLINILKVPNLSPLIKVVIESLLSKRDNGKKNLTKKLVALKGDEVKESGNYIVLPNVPEIHHSAALPYGQLFKAKVYKQNKKLVYYNPFTQSEHLIAESNHLFYKI